MTNKEELERYKSLIPADTKYPQTHPLFWADRQKAFQLIEDLQCFKNDIKNEPNAFGNYELGAGPDDEPRYITHEYNEFYDNVFFNPTVQQILNAQQLKI